MRKFTKSHEAIRKLSPEQYRVTQQNGTESPGTGEYLDNKEPGIYVDIVSGEPLFASSDKYESGCGWPSFTKPIEPANVNERLDLAWHDSHGGAIAHGDSHLGTYFPTGRATAADLGYCINSAALRLIHRDDMEAEGYGAYLNQVEDPMTEVLAILAGGCFWGVEQLIRRYDGVLLTRAAGRRAAPTPTRRIAIMTVMPKSRDHFDPARVSYRQILEFFFQIHDQAREIVRATTSGPAIDLRSSTPATSRGGLLKTRSPTWMLQACGPIRL